MNPAVLLLYLAATTQLAAPFSPLQPIVTSSAVRSTKLGIESVDTEVSASNDASSDQEGIFHEFSSFLQSTQRDIIAQLEEADGSGETFTEDRWGIFQERTYDDDVPASGSGGITRVIQGGDVIEKGACSLTLIQDGKLTEERASSISGRNDGLDIKGGDMFSAAALSIVLHTRSPMVPTFRSDVRIFLVRTEEGILAWFGGGADLTPYYLFDSDITEFHDLQKRLCDDHFSPGTEFSDTFNYAALKKACDDYFYLPARSEHRGTGGTFYDDMPATSNTLAFTKAVAESWMPSWLPIVERRKDMEYTEKQRQWQLLRRGRYLEFNLLYDRGVKFGLANANPRVEGVMVSAPPLIAWEYNHEIEEGSEEDRVMQVLKAPKDWIS
mmetsp:Transcript_48694/g.146747  ORF Transcript_48694/g.146747 Transcript_48694/m.146747 type:complete len:383 (-) Transcript_48694:58-1206(-)